MIHYLIIDDEPIAHRIIEGYANDFPELKKVGNCYDAFETMRILRNNVIDLIFLDINMPKLSGFELLKTLSDPPKVIITSAHKEFALEGYEFDIVDYLLKPFSLERFLKAVNKVVLAKGNTQTSHPFQTSRSISIKGDKKQHLVLLNDILFVEAHGNYCKVFLDDETIVTLQKISSFELLLADGFLRVHKSFIVAKDRIKSLEGNIIHLKNHSIPIGQTYKSAVKAVFNQ